jgi:hypothetical protein
MPIQRCTLPEGGQGWKWGGSGKCYADRGEAVKQAQAAYANGYREKVDLGLLLKGDYAGHEFHGNQYTGGIGGGGTQPSAVDSRAIAGIRAAADSKVVESSFASKLGMVNVNGKYTVIDRGAFDRAVAEYATRPDSMGGKVLNTDIARELSPHYMADRTQSASVHEPASAFIKELYAQKLAEPVPAGEHAVVLFTAGGTGAGKSTGLSLPEVSPTVASAHIIYDTNMNTFASADQKIAQAIAAGHDAAIVYVNRDPVDALVNGAIPRAMRQEQEFGSGRTVPLEEHLKTHEGALTTVQAIAAKYGSTGRVSVVGVNNSLGKGNARVEPIGNFHHYNNINLIGELHEALDRSYAAGQVSAATYAGFNGAAPPAHLGKQDGAGNGARDQLEGQAREKVSLRLLKFNPNHDEAGRFSEAGDENSTAKAPSPGEKFTVFRLGDKVGSLENRNAGNAHAVATHIARMQSNEGPVGKAGFGDTVTAHEITIGPKGWGQYAGFTAGGGAAGEQVGRVVTGRKNEQVAYSFPKGADFKSRLIGSVKLSSLSNFDDIGTIAGAAELRAAFKPVKKGDIAGHEFHGNQYTGGIGSSEGSPTMHALFDRVSQPDGGFTYSPTTNLEPAGGYALSIHPDRSEAFDANSIKFADLAAYAAKNRDLLTKPGNHIGAWHDPASGKIFLDVSMVTQDKAEAERLALKHDQIAYFDLNTFQSVTVNPNATSGGTVGKHHGQARASLAALEGRHGRRSEGAGAAMGKDDGSQADRSGTGGSTRQAGASLTALVKDWVAPASATSGIAGYGSGSGKKRKARRKPRGVKRFVPAL